ncbi:ABC transporter permease [Nocardioides limicola]|uniref:ABC transporter permease n=1 Tax=Nocardioides limicola TaxID=2803368 RepID=UPI00193BD692|nr:ABC transporter permease [Nocardioides sp. DJM-14]
MATYQPLAPAPAVGIVVLRNFLAYRHAWRLFMTGFLEPVFFLFSIGIGIGAMIDGFDHHGTVVSYAAFVAPALLAVSAFNGAMMDSAFNVFFKLRYQKLYDGILATPLTTLDVSRGEITWGLLRGSVYSAGFLLIMVAMGYTTSWWALLALPASVLIAFAFSAVFMAVTTYLKTWQDFEKITLAQLPMFLFSATFFPITAYEGWVRWLVEATPLYRGVVLCRELTLGTVTWDSALSVVYLAAMGVAGLWVVRRRLDTLLLS